MTDVQVRNSLNAVDRPAPADPTAILDYMMQTEFRNTAIYGRVSLVAGILPKEEGTLGAAPMGGAGNAVNMTHRNVGAARAMMRLTDTESGAITVPLTQTELSNIVTDLVDSGNGAQCMSSAQGQAIIGLSIAKQSRGREIGLGHIYLGDVQNARAL